MVVEARFYEDISGFLLKGAVQALEQAGLAYDVYTVPGALEIPAAIRLGAASRKGFEAYVALGCVLRGETTHYDIVCHESARGLGDLSLRSGLLIGNGILTCENEAQALVRARPDQENRGGAAVLAVLSLMNLRKSLGYVQGANGLQRRRWRDA
jgi:6,7-dimethyl-8-ribityllumazine synthase